MKYVVVATLHWGHFPELCYVAGPFDNKRDAEEWIFKHREPSVSHQVTELRVP